MKLEFTGRYDEAQRNFDRIEQQAVSTGGQGSSIRSGTTNITWPGGSPRANNTSVDHGLGTEPRVVIVSPETSVGGTSTIFAVPGVRSPSITSTSFELSAVTSDGSSPAAATAVGVHWIAVG